MELCEKSAKWILRSNIVPRRFRLYCFCYAGGNSVQFLNWQSELHPDFEICAIQLPGRGARFNELPLQNLSTVISEIAQVILKQTSTPFVFFGHSLGGLLAFEVTRYQRAHGMVTPLHLIISGCDAVQFRSPPKQLHLLNDEKLLDELKRLNGTPPEMLEHPELMELVLPTIRADFSLVEQYKYRIESPLNISLTILAGKQDEYDSDDQISGWQKETTNAFRIDWIEGDHFFINSNRKSVLNSINTDLEIVRSNIGCV